MVWSGIRIGGCKGLHIIQNGTLTAQSYARELLRCNVLTYTAAINNSFPLMQLDLQRICLKQKQYSIWSGQHALLT